MRKPSAKETKKHKQKARAVKVEVLDPVIVPSYPLIMDYDKTFHPSQFVAFCRQGKTPNEIAAFWGMGLGKMQVWISENEEFKEAFRVGRQAFCAYYDGIARNMFLGKMFFPQAKIFEKWMARYCNWTDDAQNPFDEILPDVEATLQITYVKKPDATEV